MLARGQAIFNFTMSPRRYNWLLQEHPLPYQSTQWLKRENQLAVLSPSSTVRRTLLLFTPVVLQRYLLQLLLGDCSLDIAHVGLLADSQYC